MDKIALWINVCADDWTTQKAIIASNAEQIHNALSTYNEYLTISNFWMQV